MLRLTGFDDYLWKNYSKGNTLQFLNIYKLFLFLPVVTDELALYSMTCWILIISAKYCNKDNTKDMIDLRYSHSRIRAFEDSKKDNTVIKNMIDFIGILIEFLRTAN